MQAPPSALRRGVGGGSSNTSGSSHHGAGPGWATSDSPVDGPPRALSFEHEGRRALSSLQARLLASLRASFLYHRACIALQALSPPSQSRRSGGRCLTGYRGGLLALAALLLLVASASLLRTSRHSTGTGLPRNNAAAGEGLTRRRHVSAAYSRPPSRPLTEQERSEYAAQAAAALLAERPDMMGMGAARGGGRGADLRAALARRGGTGAEGDAGNAAGAADNSEEKPPVADGDAPAPASLPWWQRAWRRATRFGDRADERGSGEGDAGATDADAEAPPAAGFDAGAEGGRRPLGRLGALEAGAVAEGEEGGDGFSMLRAIQHRVAAGRAAAAAAAAGAAPFSPGGGAKVRLDVGLAPGRLQGVDGEEDEEDGDGEEDGILDDDGDDDDEGDGSGGGEAEASPSATPSPSPTPSPTPPGIPALTPTQLQVLRASGAMGSGKLSWWPLVYPARSLAVLPQRPLAEFDGRGPSWRTAAGEPSESEGDAPSPLLAELLPRVPNASTPFQPTGLALAQAPGLAAALAAAGASSPAAALAAATAAGIGTSAVEGWGQLAWRVFAASNWSAVALAGGEPAPAPEAAAADPALPPPPGAAARALFAPAGSVDMVLRAGVWGRAARLGPSSESPPLPPEALPAEWRDELSTRLVIGIACGVHSGKVAANITSAADLRLLPLLSVLLPSFLPTAQPHHLYRFYFAFDYDDPIYSRDDYRQALTQTFVDAIAAEDAKRWHPGSTSHGSGEQGLPPFDSTRLLVTVHWVPCPYHGAPAWAHSHAVMAAYAEGADYVLRTNDDSRAPAPNDWVDRFVADLRARRPVPNFGVVGPECGQGATWIVTHDFTHRTHAALFWPWHYPSTLPNWSSDDWITYIYEAFGAAHVLQDVTLVHETKAVGRRYRPDAQAVRDAALRAALVSGTAVVQTWVRGWGASVMAAPCMEGSGSSGAPWCGAEPAPALALRQRDVAVRSAAGVAFTVPAPQEAGGGDVVTTLPATTALEVAQGNGDRDATWVAALAAAAGLPPPRAHGLAAPPPSPDGPYALPPLFVSQAWRSP